MTELTEPRASISAAEFAEGVRKRLVQRWGVDEAAASPVQIYQAASQLVRDRMATSWKCSNRRMAEGTTRTVGYLSAEYLLGRQLPNALLDAGLTDQFNEAMQELGFEPDDVIEAEHEPGLGNGGLGRLAACFMDSLASLDLPAIGYGIRYRYGIFEQVFDADGRQLEKPDNWLSAGDAWGYRQVERAQRVAFGGQVTGQDGHRVWRPAWSVQAVPYDYPIPGYASGRINTLRLWQSEAYDGFDLQRFNQSDYDGAVQAQVRANTISAILYPEDSTADGKRLRLEQQYFFVAASLGDAIATFYHGQDHPDLSTLPDHICFQLNDTHPVIGIAELMRILLDDFGYEWTQAWEITQRTFNYTCHTLLPEALEEWPRSLLAELLPRHMEIIERIDADFVKYLRDEQVDQERIDAMRIITQGEDPTIRMAYLATVGSTKVNGVAQLHSRLLQEVTLRDFHTVYPGKFTNVTNGVTPRRFMRLANPRLSDLITEGLGTDSWVADLSKLSGLEPLADDDDFVARFIRVKDDNKRDFALYAQRRYGFSPDPSTMFDVMVKRLHEYKRQSLKILAVIADYADMIAGRSDNDRVQPRTVIFGAKAAPGYAMAKLTIQLINNVARVINADPRTDGLLKVYFPANYNISMAEHLIPATDLDEQISQAGKEASGTSNMKFALNGALTVGTLDGANVEIREKVGAENFFAFGLNVDQVHALDAEGYAPMAYYDKDARLRAAIDMVASGAFSHGDRDTYRKLVQDWLKHDQFMVMADFGAYMDAQRRIDQAYRQPDQWARKAILNIARCGSFSSDRAVEDYLTRIWMPGTRR